MRQAASHCRVGTKEGFLGEEALGQAWLRVRVGAGPAPASFRPQYSFPRPTQTSSSPDLPPQRLCHHRPGPALHIDQNLTGVQRAGGPHRHTRPRRGPSLHPPPRCRPTDRCGLRAMGHMFLCCLVKTWQSSLVTE